MIADFDKRRRQYFPLSVMVAHSSTGVRLKEKFNRDGLLVWILYLTACKTNWIQGQMTYTSEPDGWSKLGLYGYEPDFSLESFFAYTGQLKQTKRTRSGHVIDVICTRWEEWNKEFKRDRDAAEKSSKRATNTKTKQRLPDDIAEILGATEVEVEVDVDSEAARYALWESIWKNARTEAVTLAVPALAASLRETYELDDITASKLAKAAKETAVA